MEVFPSNRDYVVCKLSAKIHGKQYNAGIIYISDEVYYCGGSFFEMNDRNGVYMGSIEEYVFDRHFMYIGAALKEVDKIFNTLIDG